MSMVDYIIENLVKVNFDKRLFVKELEKSRRWLTIDEWEVLIDWVKEFHMDKITDIDVRYHYPTHTHTVMARR